MTDVIFRRRSLPEWLLGKVAVPNQVTVTLCGQDGQVSGVPLAFLAADSSFVNSILSDSDDEEKQITLDGVEKNILFIYVSLLFTGSSWLQMDENRYLKSIHTKSLINEVLGREMTLSRNLTTC